MPVWHLTCMWSFLFASTVAATSILREAATATSLDQVSLKLDRAPQGFYVATLEVAGRRKRLLVDSGSGDLWVRTKVSSPAAGKARRQTFLDKYSSGSVSGTVLSGTVHFKQDVEATCQFGAPLKEDGVLQNLVHVDGIWGLAPKGSVESLVLCLERQDRIQSRSVSISLDRGGGTLVLGASAAGFTKLPVVGSGTWSVPLLGISVQGHGDAAQSSETQVLSSANTALLDTGSSSIHGPAASIERLAGALAAERRNDGTLQVHCEPHRLLPDVTIRLRTQDSGEVSVLVSARDLLGRADSRGWCPLKLAHSKSGLWILGDVFFQRMNAVVFDYANLAVGISVKPDSLGCSQPQPDKVIVQPHDRRHYTPVSQHATTLSHDPVTRTKTILAKHTSSKTQGSGQNQTQRYKDEEEIKTDEEIKITDKQEEEIKTDEEEMEEMKREEAEMMKNNAAAKK